MERDERSILPKNCLRRNRHALSDCEIDPRLGGLTQRELEVLILIAKGRSNKEIANVLVISLNTVRHHVHQILQKLDCASRVEAASIAIASGLLSANNI